MHGKTQASGLSGVIPLTCISAIPGQYPVFFSHPELPWAHHTESGYTPMTVRLQVPLPSWVPLGFTSSHWRATLLMMVTSLSTDMAGDTPFLSSVYDFITQPNWDSHILSISNFQGWLSINPVWNVYCLSVVCKSHSGVWVQPEKLRLFPF